LADARISALCLTLNSFVFLIYRVLIRDLASACAFASLACAALFLAAGESLLLFRLRLPRLPFLPFLPLRPLRSLRFFFFAALRLRARCLRALLARICILLLFLAMVFFSALAL